MVLLWSSISVAGLLLSQGVSGFSIKAPWKRNSNQQPRAEPYRGPAKAYVANAGRAAAVKQTFDISWNGYYEYAFPHDSLKPVTNTWSDDR